MRSRKVFRILIIMNNGFIMDPTLTSSKKTVVPYILSSVNDIFLLLGIPIVDCIFSRFDDQSKTLMFNFQNANK